MFRRPRQNNSLNNSLDNRSLDDWLEYIESLHPEEIELGLDRIRVVFGRMQLSFPAHPVITVAGTNGKGSTVAMLEAIYLAAGYRVGSYTSPHLLRYNERVRINGVDVDDLRLRDGFTAVEAARGNIQLTYFEFGTLAAFQVFARQALDLVILETGLGGRLDAVNIIDSDVAVITSIDLDHRDWLGDTREQIAIEKAGIFRAGRPAVCGDDNPPGTIRESANRVGATLHQLGDRFSFNCRQTGWDWQGAQARCPDLPLPALDGDHQIRNAATALEVVDLMQAKLPVTRAAIDAGLRQPRLPGRLQHYDGAPPVLLDVAHNPQAAAALAAYLSSNPAGGKLRAVVGMLRDKDITSSLQPMVALVDRWYLADLEGPRAAGAATLLKCLHQVDANSSAECFPTVVQAFAAARRAAGPDDRIVVFGSFLTVSAIMAQL